MASTSEVGHLKNMTNYGSETEILIGMGNVFNPANQSISLEKILDTNSKKK